MSNNPAPLSKEQQDCLRELESQYQTSVMEDYKLDELILLAHKKKISWAEIARSIGVSKQAVTKKYSEMERRAKSDEYNRLHGR
jgi:predicted DNA-binding protein YlxM (UPF0122 family)